MKKSLFILAAISTMLMSSCTKDEVKNNKVAVFIPSSDVVERWKTDKEHLSEALNAMNIDYSVYVANENTGATEQVQQISAQINAGVKTLIITPIDFNVIISSKILEGKTDLNIICHDRMIYNCKDVKYYSACDNFEIGELQASFLMQAFATSGKTSMTLEMLAGPASDNNSKDFFDGAWKVIKPYVDKGTIIIKSGKKTYNDVAMLTWSTDNAKDIMKERLTQFYPQKSAPDLMLAPNDIAAIGCVKALEQHNPDIATYPVITGQDNSEDVHTYIKEGKISMTIEKSIKDMAYNSANAAQMYLKGIKPVAPRTFDNGIIAVPYKVSSPKVITQGNL